MRYIKMFGTATVLAVAVAGYLAGSAFAAGETLPNTVFCKTEETACKAENQFSTGTAFTATLKAGTKMKWKAGYAVLECGKSSTAGTLTWNAENHTPHGVLSTSTLEECNAGQSMVVEEKPEVIFHHEVEAGHSDTGALTIVGGRIRQTVGSTSCVYGGTVAGSRLDVQGGSPATITAGKVEGETKLTKVEGGILCASPSELIAEWEITSPKPLHIGTTAGEAPPSTTLCKEKATTCEAANHYPVGTEIVAVLSEGTKAKLLAGFAAIECKGSIVAGSTSTTENVEVPIATETFTQCNEGQTVTVNTKGKLLISHKTVTKEDPVGTGTASIVGNSVTVKVGSTECTYGGTVAGKALMINGGNPASAEATEAETELEKIAGGVTCASPAKWTASYEIVRPKPLYVGTTP